MGRITERGVTQSLAVVEVTASFARERCPLVPLWRSTATVPLPLQADTKDLECPVMRVAAGGGGAGLLLGSSIQKTVWPHNVGRSLEMAACWT